MYDLTNKQYHARQKRLTTAAGNLISAVHTIGAFVIKSDDPGPWAHIRESDGPIGEMGPLTLGWANGYPVVSLVESDWVQIDTPVAAYLNVLWELWVMVEQNDDSTAILAAIKKLYLREQK